MASVTSAAPTQSDSNKLESRTVLRHALAAAQAISDDGRRAFALAALAPHQPETQLPKLDMEFAQEAGKSRRRTRCYSARRWSATARASPGRTVSRRP